MGLIQFISSKFALNKCRRKWNWTMSSFGCSALYTPCLSSHVCSGEERLPACFSYHSTILTTICRQVLNDLKCEILNRATTLAFDQKIASEWNFCLGHLLVKTLMCMLACGSVYMCVCMYGMYAYVYVYTYIHSHYTHIYKLKWT